MRWARSLVMAMLLAAPPTVPTVDTAPASPPEDHVLSKEAQRAMQRQAWSDALQRYAVLRERRPGVPEIPYNMGVAAFKGGDYEGASEYFSDAMELFEDPALRARAAYNLGTSEYAQSLDAASSDPAGGQMEEAMTSLRDALQHYRTALDHDPSDRDARVNGELTQRRLQELQELQQAMEQPQSGDENQDGDQESESQNQTDAQNQPSPGEDQPSAPSDSAREDGEPQPGEPQPAEPEPGEAEPGEEEQGPPEPAPADENEGEEEESEAGGEEGVPPTEMTREEAERLLQSVRDKERARREELARARASKLPPVDKDW